MKTFLARGSRVKGVNHGQDRRHSQSCSYPGDGSRGLGSRTPCGTGHIYVSGRNPWNGIGMVKTGCSRLRCDSLSGYGCLRGHPRRSCSQEVVALNGEPPSPQHARTGCGESTQRQGRARRFAHSCASCFRSRSAIPVRLMCWNEDARESEGAWRRLWIRTTDGGRPGRGEAWARAEGSHN